MLRCSGSALMRAARIGMVVGMVVGALAEFTGRWYLTSAAAHGPAAKLAIVVTAKYATFACMMVYWVLPPVIEGLQARQMAPGARTRLGLILSARAIASVLGVVAVAIIAEGLTGLIWR